MRLVTWNCCGGFRNKAPHVAKLRPDVLVVPEVEPIDGEPLDGEQPTFREQIADPAYPRRKGIGVFSYTDTKLTAVDVTAAMHSFRRYEANCRHPTFQVVGIWTVETEQRETDYRQAHDGIRCHMDWIRQRPTVILGDFNHNKAWGDSWLELLGLMETIGLVSAYHQYFSEPFGEETQPTYFHHRQETATKFHYDYCFLPDSWKPQIEKVSVGTYNDWHTISDHMPLIVDLDP